MFSNFGYGRNYVFEFGLLEKYTFVNVRWNLEVEDEVRLR